MTGERERVDTKFVYVERYLARRLRRIGMRQRAIRPRQGGDLGHGLNRTHLVVGVHHQHQGRVGSQSGAQIMECNVAVTIYPEHG